MYKLCKNSQGIVDTVLRIADQAWIPMNSDNTDYQAYLAWLEAGNTPLPADGE